MVQRAGCIRLPVQQLSPGDFAALQLVPWTIVPSVPDQEQALHRVVALPEECGAAAGAVGQVLASVLRLLPPGPLGSFAAVAARSAVAEASYPSAAVSM